MKNIKWLFVGMLFLVVPFVLAGCGGGGGGSSSPPPTYSISGTVSGFSVQGVTITLLSGATNLATTTTNTSGAYIFNGVANGTYTVTPSKTSSAFNPLNQSVTVSGSNVASVNFTAVSATTTYSISGTVSGATQQGVTITLSGPNSGTAVTASNGTYTFSGLVTSGTYTVTPSKSGYTFTPSNTAVSLSGANVANQNFTATAIPTTFAISGTVSGAIQQGVLITLSGAGGGTTTTGVGGTYSFSGMPNGTYTITPSLTGYTFSPANLSVTVSGADVTGKNFTSTAVTYSISGTVSGATAQGVTITLSGAAGATTTTDSSGNYTITGLTNGNYTVTPSLTGYTFSPASTAVTINNANATGTNFVSSVVTAPTYSISGSVNRLGGGALAGATVTLSVGANGTTTTDATGAYTFTNLVAGSYTVTPSLPGYTIAPANVTITNANVTQNFTAASTVAGYSVSGTVSYSGANTGKTGVYVMWSGGGTTGLGTTLSGTSGTGSYTIRGLQNGNYVVFAGMDTVGNGIPNVADPSGSTAMFSVSNGNVAGQNVTMTDPTLPTPSVPANLGVFPINNGAIVSWDTVQCPPNPFNSCDGATAYKIYSSSTGSTGTFNLVATVPETDNGVYIQTGLTNSNTYYYKISSLIGTTESAQSTAFGPVIIGVPAGGVSVSGAITFSGSAAGHTMFIGLYGNSGIYGTTVVSPTSPQTYTISGVQPGSYNLFAFVDMDSNGYFNTGDIVPIFDLLPTVTVSSSNITGQNLTLPSGNASAAIRTVHEHNPSGTPADQYVVEQNIYSLLKMPMKVTIMSGLNIPLPYDMAVTRPQSSGSWIMIGSALPALGDAYTYQVTYSDGTTETFTPAVTGVLTSSNMATPATPANNATGVSATPTFIWTAPATPLTGYFYDQVGVQPSSGGNWIWNYPNSGKTGIPSSQTSVKYNADGSASQASLTSLTSYQWWISTSDSNGNLGQNYATFMTQ